MPTLSGTESASLDRIFQYIDPSSVWRYRDMLLEGLWVTFSLSVLTLLISLVPAVFVALGRKFGPRWLERVLATMINLSRSVPTVLTVVFIYLALPFVGLTLSAFASVLLALSIMQVVYFSEVFRGALASIDEGQYDAARALGLSTPLTLIKVIAPQAALVAAPPFVSALILMVQHTSIASAIALNDLITASLSIQNMTGQSSPLLAAAIGYLIIILPMVRLARRWERSAASARAR